MSDFDQESLREVVAEIKRQQSLLDYLRNTLGFQLRYAGSGMYTMPCPLHGGSRNGSFYVYTRGKGEFWICYGKCGREKGDLIEFIVQHNNNWNDKKIRPIDVINDFAKKFGINYTVTDVDIAERAYQSYLKSIEAPLKEDDNLQSINYQVSMHCKKLARMYPYAQVEEIIEKVYESLDRCIVERSVDMSEDRATWARAKKDLEILREDVIPSLDRFCQQVKNTRDALEKIKSENAICSSCYLRYGCQRVVNGDGSFLSRVMFLDYAPSKIEDETGIAFEDPDHFPLIRAIEANGYKPSDVWMDFIVHCHGKVTQNEARICRNLWLERRIEIIKPVAVMVFGKDAQKTLFPNEDVGKRKTVDSVEYWFCPHPTEIIRAGGLNSEIYRAYEAYIGMFLKQFIPKKTRF